MTQDKPFFAQKNYDAERNLHWPGFKTAHELYTLSKFTEFFAKKAEAYERIPFFKKTVENFAFYSQEQLHDFQNKYLDIINHDQFASIYTAFMPRSGMDELRETGKQFFQAGCRFAQELAAGKGRHAAFETWLSREHPEMLEPFRQAVNTSLLNYARYDTDGRYGILAAEAPLYAECGIDFMYDGSQFRFAELQFSYQSYPHNLDTLYAGLKKLFPVLMIGTAQSTYTDRRLAQLSKAVNNIAAFRGLDADSIRKVVLDAWTATRHPTRNYKALARSMGADYWLFDEFDDRLAHGQMRSYENLTRHDKALFMFNQPLAWFFEPHPFFAPIQNEKLEVYPHIGLPGAWEDYLERKLFLANPPVIDLLNDKAIYEFLPLLAEFYTGFKSAIEVSHPAAVWDETDPLKMDQAMYKRLIEKKDECVLCHRYLEAGDGIRIGKNTSVDEWAAFIERYVAEKPYLFVCRDFFKMDPDITFRLYASGNLEFNGGGASVETSDALLGRLNHSGSLLEQSHFFVCNQL